MPPDFAVRGGPAGPSRAVSDFSMTFMIHWSYLCVLRRGLSSVARGIVDASAARAMGGAAAVCQRKESLCG